MHVRKNVSIAVMIFAWLCANGAVWDVVQVFAWGRMFANYTQTLSVNEALKETFDANNPCNICRMVHRARDVENDRSPISVAMGNAEKFLLAKVTVEPFIFTPPDAAWPHLEAVTLVLRTEQVPVPPPRV